MANSAQEYIDKLYNQSRGMAGQLHEQRKQSDDEVIQQINAAIDRATASSTNPYKTQMEQLPSQYQSLFDANAVQELVGRRQVQEAMANMGLTDSGLNRTQQTALSVQRGNADASVRLAQQQKTQELQDKISQLVENSAAQKQQQEASIRANTSDWYNTLLSNFYSTAQQQGTSLYNAEQERAAAAAEAERQRQAEAEASKEALRKEMLSIVQKKASDYPTPEEAKSYLENMVNNGYISPDDAVYIYQVQVGGDLAGSSQNGYVPVTRDELLEKIGRDKSVLTEAQFNQEKAFGKGGKYSLTLGSKNYYEYLAKVYDMYMG